MNQVFAKEISAMNNIALMIANKPQIQTELHSLNGVTLQMIPTLKVFACPLVLTMLSVLLLLMV
jgi:hypothetical protein